MMTTHRCEVILEPTYTPRTTRSEREPVHLPSREEICAAKRFDMDLCSSNLVFGVPEENEEEVLKKFKKVMQGEIQARQLVEISTTEALAATKDLPAWRVHQITDWYSEIIGDINTKLENNVHVRIPKAVANPDYSLDQNTVNNLAYFNYAKAKKLKVKASKKIKKLLAGMDDNNFKKVNSSKFNKSNKSADDDVEENLSAKTKKKCSKCGKWGYHTAEECKAKDNDDKSSRLEEANLASGGKGKSLGRRVQKLIFLDYNNSDSPGPGPDKDRRLAWLSFTPSLLEAPGLRRRSQYRRCHVKKLRYDGRCAVRRCRASVCRCLSVCKQCCSDVYVCKCDKGFGLT